MSLPHAGVSPPPLGTCWKLVRDCATSRAHGGCQLRSECHVFFVSLVFVFFLHLLKCFRFPDNNHTLNSCLRYLMGCPESVSPPWRQDRAGMRLEQGNLPYSLNTQIHRGEQVSPFLNEPNGCCSCQCKIALRDWCKQDLCIV